MIALNSLRDADPSTGDPFTAKRVQRALADIAALTKLEEAIHAYKTWKIARAGRGGFGYSDEDHARLAFCEAVQAVEHTDGMDARIEDIRFEMGLSGAEDLFGNAIPSPAARLASARFDQGKM